MPKPGPEPIGCLAESNESPVLPSGTGDVDAQIASPTRSSRTGARAEQANAKTITAPSTMLVKLL